MTRRGRPVAQIVSTKGSQLLQVVVFVVISFSLLLPESRPAGCSRHGGRSCLQYREASKAWKSTNLEKVRSEIGEIGDHDGS